MRILCATNLFCWSAHVCYSLYFTDFVGEAVFGGDPQASFVDKFTKMHNHCSFSYNFNTGCRGISQKRFVRGRSAFWVLGNVHVLALLRLLFSAHRQTLTKIQASRINKN
jgi:hypothetical protein